MPEPKGSTGTDMAGISCSAAPSTSCTDVGAYSNGSAFIAFAEGWNGTKWTPQKTPEPAGATEGDLVGVSCSSPPGTCSAVGYDANSAGTSLTLAEGWNGTKWSIQKTPPA